MQPAIDDVRQEIGGGQTKIAEMGQAQPEVDDASQRLVTHSQRLATKAKDRRRKSEIDGVQLVQPEIGD